MDAESSRIAALIVSGVVLALSDKMTAEECLKTSKSLLDESRAISALSTEAANAQEQLLTSAYILLAAIKFADAAHAKLESR